MQVVSTLDSDSNLFTSESQIGSNPAIQRFQKTSSVLNELIGQIFREGFAIEGINYDNIEQVYNPLLTGLGSLHATHEYLMSQGMSPDTSNMLCRKYLNQLAQTENHQCTLMDLFCDQTSKNALHRPGTDLRSVALNFQSSDPRLARIRDESSPRLNSGRYSSLQPAVKPPTGLYLQA